MARVAMSPGHLKMKQRTQAFIESLKALARNETDVETIMKDHFRAHGPRITEYGPAWARSRLPFLGQSFQGVAGCTNYFELLADTLEFVIDETVFPGPEQFIIDQDTRPIYGNMLGATHVKALGKWKAVGTGQAWTEVFAYRLSDFDTDAKIGHWEIWADPLSAWLAVGGELDEAAKAEHK